MLWLSVSAANACDSATYATPKARAPTQIHRLHHGRRIAVVARDGICKYLQPEQLPHISRWWRPPSRSKAARLERLGLDFSHAGISTRQQAARFEKLETGSTPLKKRFLLDGSAENSRRRAQQLGVLIATVVSIV